MHFGGLFRCYCEFSRSSLVSRLPDRVPRKKPLLTVEVLRFRDGNSNILNKSSETKILSYVSCFYLECLAKMKNKPFLRQCLLTKQGFNPVIFFLDVSERSTEVKKQIFAPKVTRCDEIGAVTQLSEPTLSWAALGQRLFFWISSLWRCVGGGDQNKSLVFWPYNV